MRITFPMLGLHKGAAGSNQPSLTSPDMNNVRPIDALDGRARGGQRPGLDKWGAGTQIGATERPVVAMCVVRSVL